MKKLCCIVLILLAAARVAAADNTGLNDPNEILKTRPDFVVCDSNDPNELLMNTFDAVVKILAAEDIELKVKEKVIDKILSPLFDFPLMAKLTLGRKHWPRLSDAQAEKFTRLFTRRIKDSYRKKITLYEDQKAVLGPAKRNKKTVQIPMQITSEEKTIDILYKFRNSEKRWKIYDVEIQGVSILLTYRSQFEDILQSGSINDLLARLKSTETD